ncbi:MAG: alpha/beta hydrolase [Symploca sp. SIO2E6]|nr:alpha/beta hydrolase [Symploca sp. SIO2E6]
MQQVIINSLLITHYSLLITHYSLLITHYSLLITHSANPKYVLRLIKEVR